METALQFSNGNSKLAKGIQAQLEMALDSYEQGTQLPLEMNLGIKPFTLTVSYLLLINFVEPGYSGMILWSLKH